MATDMNLPTSSTNQSSSLVKGVGSPGQSAGGSGWGTAISAVLGDVTDLITYFANRADYRKATKEAKSIDARNWAEGLREQGFSEDIQTQNLALNKRAQAFNEKQTPAGNMMNINQSMIQKLTDTINSSEQLKNAVIGRWAV